MGGPAPARTHTHMPPGPVCWRPRPLAAHAPSLCAPPAQAKAAAKAAAASSASLASSAATDAGKKAGRKAEQEAKRVGGD